MYILSASGACKAKSNRSILQVPRDYRLAHKEKNRKNKNQANTKLAVTAIEK